MREKNTVYVGFIDRVTREALWQVLRMYDVEGVNFLVELRACMLIVQFMSFK